MIAVARRVVEELVHQLGRRGDLADAEWRLAHAFQRERERLHVGDFARHEKLECVLGALRRRQKLIRRS